mgnify:CR=1 FL=1
MLAFKVILQARPGRERSLEEALLTMRRDAAKEDVDSAPMLFRALKNRGRFLLLKEYTDRDSFERGISAHYVEELSLKLEDLIEEPFDAALYRKIGEIKSKEDKKRNLTPSGKG